MRIRVWVELLLVGGLAWLGLAGAASAGAAVRFGPTVFAPVAGAAFQAGDTVGLAPVAGSWAVTLTRVADAVSGRLGRARTVGTRLRTVGLSWSDAGGLESLCLGDVVVTSFVTRPPSAGGGRAVEHATLFFAAAARVHGSGACAKLPPGSPVVVRLYTDAKGGGLHARVDCLAAQCRGALRLTCPTEGCPAGGLGVGAFDLGAGQEAVLGVRLGHSVRGRHPRLTATTTLAGRPGPVASPVVVDAPPPGGLPTLLSTTPVPAPPGVPASDPTGTGATGGGSPGAGGVGPGGSGAGVGGSAGGGSIPDSGPVLGVPGGGGTGGGGSGGDAIETTVTLGCVGPAGSFSGVDGALDPGLAGAAIEIDYVPVDDSLDTVIHNVTTGPGGRFSDTSGGTPFVRAVGFYPGDETYLGAIAFCP